ncbi:: HK97-gp10_like [Gemmataceae bacterium]|nr:: HK97-gp10_like [Gemmataceae bacterium]VTU02777.1 : HK97-gp10_like [Gemmataceae bacterium]
MIARYELDLSPAAGLKGGGLRKALRIGLNRAASPVKAAVVSNAEAVKRYGFLAKAIRIRTKVYPADKFVAVIGPSSKFVRQKGKFKKGKRKGQPKKAIPAKYAHLVERGTKRSRAQPFLGKAHAETAARFLDQVGAEVGREIEQELARRAKR